MEKTDSAQYNKRFFERRISFCISPHIEQRFKPNRTRIACNKKNKIRENT